MLCREVLLVKTYEHKPGTKESGNAWSLVSEHLNAIQHITFSTSQKSVRDRYRLLIEKHKKKMREQESSSVTVDEETELDNLLQNVKEDADTANENHDKTSQEKKKQITNDAKNAEDIRKKTMESFSETRKRKELSNDTVSQKSSKHNN